MLQLLCRNKELKKSKSQTQYLTAYVSIHVTTWQRIGEDTVLKNTKNTSKSLFYLALSMGRQSNAVRAHIKNLNNPIKTRKKVSIKDVTDEEDEDFPAQEHRLDNNPLEKGFFLDEDDDSDEDDDYDDEDIDEEEFLGLKTEADIVHFNVILAEAQAITIQAENKAAELKPKWKRHYTGNSICTTQCHAMKQQQLEAKGQKFISAWFSKKKDPPSAVPGVSDHEEEENETEDEFEEPEIEERINHLFLSSSPVSLNQIS